MVNLAEELHRERRRRERSIEGDAPLRGSLETLDNAAEVLVDDLDIRIVFTAHPTEVLRRTTSEKHAIVAELLRELDQRILTAEEKAEIEAELHAQIVLLWQSNELYRTAPTVHDEVRNLLARFRESIFDEAPLLFERLEAQLGREVPTILSFGSWIGSDRDGNANVAPDAVIRASEQARAFLFRHYVRGIERLQARFSQDVVRGQVSLKLVASVDADAAAMPDVKYTIGPRQEAEPYRRKLAFVHRKLTLAQTDAQGGYEHPQELLDDLETIENSLRTHSGAAVALPLRRLRRTVEVFGFHLYSLEWRNHRDKVVRTLDEIVAAVEPGTTALSERDAVERSAWFARELVSPRPLIPHAYGFSAEAQDIIASLRAVATLRNSRGPKTVTSFILAGTEASDDILALFALVRACGALDAGPAQLVPLLESASSLAHGAVIADTLLRHPAFHAHVTACGGVWEIMLGYSDTTKLAGIVASMWGIYRAQQSLVAVGERHHIGLRFFHGRGGSVGRGAADAHEAVNSQPPAARNGTFKVTEQGEVISARYGLPSLARRNLELAVTAVIGGMRRRETIAPAWGNVLDRLAARAEQAYVGLIESPQFLEFFGACTPVNEIDDLQISSRPGRRGVRSSVADMRAIPWSFGWAQARVNLPGWFGFGTAVRAHEDALDDLRAMAAGFPFFSTLLRNIERALAIADLTIFERYARELVADKELRSHFVSVIEAEYRASVDAILAILGSDRLLAGDPVLARSIALRNPYVDPISLLQVRLLKAYRTATDERDPVLRNAIRLSINGIAAGLRVTG